MAIKTNEALKLYFESGDVPTQSQFGDLIDSLSTPSNALTDTTNFKYNLSSADTTVQKSLETLDKVSIPTVITIKASDGPSWFKNPDYTCDGVSDQVQVNLALAKIKDIGGKIIISPGTLYCSNYINIIGKTANNVGNPQIFLEGSGIDATKIVTNPGKNCIEITDEPKYDISFISINVKGSAHGIYQIAGTERGNWQSHIHDIYIDTDWSTHTGWGIYMESPFRMRFTNIEMNGVANGMWLTSHTDSFNPGNFSVDRLFIDLWNNASNAGAIGVKLSVLNSNSTGMFNLASFTRVDISGGSALTSSIGINLVGATGSYGETREIDFNSLNIEDVQTAFKLVDASDNTFTNINYTRVLPGGTVFDLNSESLNNRFENTYLDSNVAGATFTLINDAGNDSAQPNVFSRITGWSSGTTTINGTLVDSTIIEHMALTGGGPTIDSDLIDRNDKIMKKIKYGSSSNKPVANESTLGTLYITKGASGVADVLEVCLKSSADTYSWVNIANG